MIDVIIPAYNAHKTIERTLFSIAYQDYVSKVCVYIIDDNSKNNYDDVVDFFSKFMKIKQYKLSKNYGPGYARQYGIDHSKGEFIMFMDSDDVLYDCYSIKNMYEGIIKNSSDVVIGNFFEEINGDFYSHNSDSIWLHGKMYRRSFLVEHNIKFNNTRSNEDNGFNQFLFLCEPKIYFLNDYVYIWINNKISITRDKEAEYDYKGLKWYVYNINYAIEQALKNNCNLEKISSLAFATLAASYHYYLQYYEKEKYMNEMIEECKKTLLIYNKYPIDETQKITILKQQFEYSFCNMNAKYLLNPIISFDVFLARLGDNLC